tara:strand:+ start:1461 stop:1940 length:480 start_codon:yes stop_codon:yes gene_type:complete
MLLKRYLAAVLLLIFSLPSYAGQYEGRVIKVVDGDTIWVKTGNKHIKIRLSYIDAPELKQAYGIRSKNFLTNLVLDKNVQINTNKKDRYNRHLGEVYIHNANESVFVNAKMLKSGNAWIYLAYRENSYLINLENYARINKLGLWSEQGAIEPWVYRRSN